MDYARRYENALLDQAVHAATATAREKRVWYQTSEDLALDEILTKAWESAANVGPPSTEFMKRHRTALREYRASFRGSGDDFFRSENEEDRDR